MKVLSYFFILIFVGFVVYMFQYIDKIKNIDHRNMCDHITHAAAIAMTGRQQGDDIDDMIAKFSALQSDIDNTEKLNRIHANLINSAYAQQIHINQSDQNNEIERFSKQSFYKYCVYIH
jgi:vacuolar-type H+-ATPase catalytic subunit A/Vma1